MLTEFFKTVGPTPLLNQCPFLIDLDDQGLNRCLEMILLPSTPLRFVGEMGDYFAVTCDEYPGGPYFVPKLAVKPGDGAPRRLNRPSQVAMAEALRERLGKPYLWGGNWAAGLSPLLPVKPENRREHWANTLYGVDCSGLLFEVADGGMPRNTSDLLHFGSEESVVKPLYIIVWPGHMVICLDETYCIESKLEWGGVVMSKISDRLKLIDEPYSIRSVL